LWSGSEGGVIKVWYGEAIEKSLVSQREEKRKTSHLHSDTLHVFIYLVAFG
jgi:hypothetical protein